MRTTLPARRHTMNFEFTWNQTPFIGAIGFDRTNRPLEVFLSCGKTTSEIEAVGRDAAILISLLLQRGGNFQEMRDAITRSEDSSAASLIGCLLDEIEKITLQQVQELIPCPSQT